MYGHLFYARWTPILLEAAVFLRFCLMSPGSLQVGERPGPPSGPILPLCILGSAFTWGAGWERSRLRYPGVYSSCKRVVMGVEPSSLERMLGGDTNIREGRPVS